ncbi:MAG: hypothetical protein ACTSU5_00495 [Promethearchaeota archaeon]
MEKKFVKAKKVADDLIKYAEATGDGGLREEMQMFNVEVENQKSKLIYGVISDKKKVAEDLYSKLKYQPAIDTARDVIDLAVDAGIEDIREEMTMFVVQAENVMAKFNRELAEKKDRAEALYGRLKYREAIGVAREIIEMAEQSGDSDLKEAMIYFIVEVENKMAKVERDVIADKKKQAEELFDRGDFQEAIDLARDVVNFARDAGEKDVEEAFTYFIIEAENQLAKLDREALAGRPGAEVSGEPGTVTAAGSESSQAPPTTVELTSNIEEVIQAAGIRRKYHWFGNEAPYRASKVFGSKESAIDYCITLEDAGKIAWINFKMVKVIRSALAGKFQFDEGGTAWVVYERD